MDVSPLPGDKILGLSILKAFSDNTFIVQFLARLFSEKTRGIAIALASLSASCKKFDIL